MQIKIKKSTPVMVHNTTRSGDTEYGPIPASHATKHIISGVGTIAAWVEIAPGHDYEGAPVYFVGDDVFAQIPEEW